MRGFSPKSFTTINFLSETNYQRIHYYVHVLCRNLLQWHNNANCSTIYCSTVGICCNKVVVVTTILGVIHGGCFKCRFSQPKCHNARIYLCCFETHKHCPHTSQSSLKMCLLYADVLYLVRIATLITNIFS